MFANSTAIHHNNTVIHGWVHQTNGRGTLDILQSCAWTIFLCCWTSVCVNIPAVTDTHLARFREKFNLFCFGIGAPEGFFVLAMGQWLSARQSVKLFHANGYSTWTMIHAFFADMGGFVLQPADWKSFPLDADQLYYMISKGYLAYPELDKAVIDDKNKANGIARFITIAQVLWFTMNCIGRLARHLALTTLELTTLAFIFVMLATSIFWWHKPMDVGHPIILKTHAPIATILTQAGPSARRPYKHTPLDFVSRKEWYWSRVWKHYLQTLRDLHIGPLFSRSLKARPNDRIPSDNWPEISPFFYRFLIGAILFSYTAIFVCGWNFSFPTRIECVLWRVASSYTIIGGALGLFVGEWYQRFILPQQDADKLLVAQAGRTGSSIKRTWFRQQAEKAILGMRNNSPDHDPLLETPLRVLIPATILMYGYTWARMYIFVEDFIGLRELPSSAFDTVNWFGGMPHL